MNGFEEMPPHEKRKAVWLLRQNGMTLSAIGKMVNRSKGEVRRLSCMHERLEKERVKRQTMMNGLTKDEVLNTSILNLELNARARNHFSWSPSVTVSDIMAMSDEELRAPNIGMVTIAEIRAAINTALANAEKANQ